MIAADSLLHLRARRMRHHVATDRALLPIDELQQQVANKRRKTGKSVDFDMKKTVSIECGAVHATPLNTKWMTREESAEIRQGMARTVANFRKDLMDPQTECVRGLEIYADSMVRMEKQRKAKAFCGLILKQQCLLQSTAPLGGARGEMLAHMSRTLSILNVTEARNAAAKDADEAFWIHVSGMTAEEQEETFEKELMGLLQNGSCEESGTMCC